MGRLTLFTGGVRSGKSGLAVAEAARWGTRIRFAATAIPRPTGEDPEMDARIERHRRERPGTWETVEIDADPGVAIRNPEGIDGILLDCLTLWVAGRCEAGWDRERLLSTLDRFLEGMRAIPPPVAIVTNEVGAGVVPPTESGRIFRDLAGEANRIVGEAADRVLLVVCGRGLEIPPR